MIGNVNELKEYFRRSPDMLNDSVYVKTSLRNEWLLNGESTIIDGRVYDVSFKNKKGGIWEAKIMPIGSPVCLSKSPPISLLNASLKE